MKPIDYLGGRKNILGYLFLGCCTYLTVVAMQKETSDLLGLSTVIGAIAAGTFGLVWGNVKEHQAAGANNATVQKPE